VTLHSHLVLHSFITDKFGGDFEGLIDALRGADDGVRPDGQTNCFGVLESRASQLKIDLDTLRRYDRNILDHEAAIGRNRPGFRLKYFQRLAAIYSEVYLDRFTQDPVQLLIDLDDFRAVHFPDLPSYQARDLRKLAFWMATGAGKTLVMHLNLRQFMDYLPFDPQNILLLTPTETLSLQHTEELLLSGIDVLPASSMTSVLNGVRVIEVTKLYVENPSARGRKGGVSLPTSDFEGPNLILVDEGHKGTSTSADRKMERAWRDIRQALVGETGFTFEYSATFAQVTQNNDELFQEYRRAILFEYAYARFHGDGYGKDYEVINLKDKSAYGQRLLMAGLLTLYEQQCAYAAGRAELVDYNPEPPLMIFVGSTVTGGSDVIDVIGFLGRVLADPNWATAEIATLLAGKSGLPGPDGRDVFVYKFSLIKKLHSDPAMLYSDLLQRVFYGGGMLGLHLLRRADGEIGLRSAGSTQDWYCGVINVGEPVALIKKIKGDPEIQVAIGADDHISGSAFEGIDEPGSSINLLVGSKKFIEGWSSWRVSVMGLLNVGTNAGAQVLQLFGRGVRLKGYRWGLKRAAELPGVHPAELSLLEQLTIFGLKANYLQEFFKTLKREELALPVLRILPLSVDPAWANADLLAVEPDAAYRSMRSVFTFNPTGLDVKIELLPTVVIGDASGSTTFGAKKLAQLLPAATRELLPYETLFERAMAYKVTKGWDNLYIGRATLHRLFETDARFSVPDEIFSPSHPEHLRVLERIAGQLVESALQRFYTREQQRVEHSQLQMVAISPDHSNVPRITEDGATIYAYQLRVPEPCLAEVDAILATEAERLRQDRDEPLPRLHVDSHLFQPLLVKSKTSLKSSPVGLEPSEEVFALDLQKFWAVNHGLAPWDDCELYLLRNVPKTGIGFFETAGFYPDFLLWLKRSDKQVLAFIDPKGLTHWEEEKVALLVEIRKLPVDLPLLAFIATPTQLSGIQPAGVAPADKAAYLANRHVLLQEDPHYIRVMLDEMFALL
jgi:hypothetical protein